MRYLLLFALFVSFLFLLSSCSECEVDSDCPVSGGDCLSPVCSNNKCSEELLSGCCGNFVCEDSEDVCSCGSDCVFDFSTSGNCEGRAKIPYERKVDKYYDASVAEYFCSEDDVCSAGVKDSKVSVVKLFSSHPGRVSFDMTSFISSPFVLGKGNMSVKVVVSDISSYSSFPVVLSKIQVLSGNELLSERLLDDSLLSIGDSTDISLFLQPVLTVVEEKLPLSVKVSYSAYSVNSYDSSKELFRDSFTTSYQPIFFVDSSRGVYKK